MGINDLVQVVLLVVGHGGNVAFGIGDLSDITCIVILRMSAVA